MLDYNALAGLDPSVYFPSVPYRQKQIVAEPVHVSSKIAYYFFEQIMPWASGRFQ